MCFLEDEVDRKEDTGLCEHRGCVLFKRDGPYTYPFFCVLSETLLVWTSTENKVW